MLDFFARKTVGAAVVFALFLAPCLLAEQDPVAPEVVSAEGQVREADPAPLLIDGAAFDYDIEDGLYATITSMQSFKKPDIKNERKFKLQNIDGFKKKIEVRAILQDKPAPLVVILLGLTSKSKDPLARLWQAQLSEAGNHVLVFDSIFRPSFNECSTHGVAGNLEVEAQVAAKVINAFMRHPEVEGRVTRVGLLGASYGGMLALNFAKLAGEGRIAIVPDKVLVFSPPVSMRSAAQLLDKYHDQDFQKQGIFDLLDMSGHKPVEKGRRIPFNATQMRGGIGYVFHSDLEAVIECSKDLYDYKLPKLGKDERGKNEPKDSRAFTRFIEQVVFSYWSKNGGVATVQELWNFGDLDRVLKACPNTVHCVLAQDDPLNDSTDLQLLKLNTPAEKLTVLPRGGHLGYVGCDWTMRQVLKMFEKPEPVKAP
jgi:predicted alpha/beta-fold hydrolase